MAIRAPDGANNQNSQIQHLQLHEILIRGDGGDRDDGDER